LKQDTGGNQKEGKRTTMTPYRSSIVIALLLYFLVNEPFTGVEAVGSDDENPPSESHRNGVHSRGIAASTIARDLRRRQPSIVDYIDNAGGDGVSVSDYDDIMIRSGM